MRSNSFRGPLNCLRGRKGISSSTEHHTSYRGTTAGTLSLSFLPQPRLQTRERGSGEGKPDLLQAQVAGSPWQLSRDLGNQAPLAFSSRDLAPIPGQEKRAQSAVFRRRKCCCLGGSPGKDSGKTWGSVKSLSVLVSASVRSGLNRKKVGTRGE